MKLRARILKVTRETGPRPRPILRGLASRSNERAVADKVIDDMIAAGEIVKFGATKGATYGAPRGRKA